MKKRILVVDDSPFIHKAIARVLPEDAYEICGVGKNGQEGVELYQSLRPDVVTMDITMPIMNGLDAAKQILTKDPKARIVMLSALGDEEIVQEARTTGIKVLLQKPFKGDDLLAALGKALADEAEAERSSQQQEDSYFQYFYTSLSGSLKTMADIDCSSGEAAVQQSILESHGVAVILGITGATPGRVILDTSKKVACELCGIMNGEEYDPGDEFVLFSLAELVNILSGNAISIINDKFKVSLKIGPPSVFVGESLSINSPKVKAEIVKVETAAGAMYLSVGFEGGR